MQKAISLIVILTVSSTQQYAVEESKAQEEEYTTDFPKVVLNPNASFVIPYIKANWHKSVEFCNFLGLRLVTIDSKEREKTLYQVIKASKIYSNEGNRMVWVGASDLADEGNFRWHGTGTRVVYSNWANRQPDNGDGIEHCVEAELYEHPELGIKWQWNDRDCTLKRNFVCEKYLKN